MYHQIGDRVELEITPWLAERLRSDTCCIEGAVMNATDRAILVQTVDGGEIWLPRSEVE